MSEFFDYDPFTGITSYFDYDELTGKATINQVADVEPLLDYTKALARDGGTDQGIKQSWWLYAKIPPIVQLQMRAKGIKLDDPSMTKRIIQEINENYPYLKCTQKNEEKKLAIVHDLGR